MLAPGALHVFTHLAEDVFLALSNRLLPLPQPGFAVGPPAVSVTWVPPLTSVLPKARAVGSAQLCQPWPQPLGKEMLHSLGLGCGVLLEGSWEGRACRGEQCLSFPAVFSAVMLLPGSGCPWALHCSEQGIH